MIFIIPVFLYNKYKSGDIGTLISVLLFMISASVFYFAVQNYLTFVLLLITGISLVYFLLKGIGNTENRNYFPYVPALALAAFVGITINMF